VPRTVGVQPRSAPIPFQRSWCIPHGATASLRRDCRRSGAGDPLPGAGRCSRVNGPGHRRQPTCRKCDPLAASTNHQQLCPTNHRPTNHRPTNHRPTNHRHPNTATETRPEPRPASHFTLPASRC
jgi:hypothetical protein